jgi:hypothetical protein
VRKKNAGVVSQHPLRPTILLQIAKAAMILNTRAIASPSHLQTSAVSTPRRQPPSEAKRLNAVTGRALELSTFEWYGHLSNSSADSGVVVVLANTVAHRLCRTLLVFVDRPQ